MGWNNGFGNEFFLWRYNFKKKKNKDLLRQGIVAKVKSVDNLEELTDDVDLDQLDQLPVFSEMLETFFDKNEEDDVFVEELQSWSLKDLNAAFAALGIVFVYFFNEFKY